MPNWLLVTHYHAFRFPWYILVGAVLAFPMGGCRTYAYLLGYPVPAKPAQYRYYDPSFAAHNALALRGNKLHTTGFYYEPEASENTANQPLDHTRGGGVRTTRAIDYLKFNPDGSFHLGSVALPLTELPVHLMRISPIGYYKITGDTSWLELRHLENKPRVLWGYAVFHTDSVQVNVPGLHLGGYYLRYHP